MSDSTALREQYFEWAANVNIYGERLVNHDYAYQTSLADRERRQDQGEVLPDTDGDFKADAQRRRNAIVLALNKAIDNADRLKAKCEEAGIDHNPQIRNI
jgi:hypothetical protein